MLQRHWNQKLNFFYYAPLNMEPIVQSIQFECQLYIILKYETVIDTLHLNDSDNNNNNN